jgi:acetyl esterase/lipase
MRPISLIPGQPQVIPLWEDGEIDVTGWDQPEEIVYFKDGLKVIRNVSRPTLTAYLPDPALATGTSVIVCPGGAYQILAFEHEGIQVAQWLNAHGIAAFLLKYRLVQTGSDFPQCIEENLNDPHKMETVVAPHFPLISADGCQAVRLVRAHAHEWNLATNRVGIMGFSAGGMLTLSVALHFDSTSRPDFAAPIYSAPPPAAPVPANAPPLFLLCAADDDMASAVSTQFYTAWREANHPVELHIYAKGGHGFGMNQQGLPSDIWIERFTEWLQSAGLLSKKKMTETLDML